ncbi:MAG: helix-turn-helix transcriptional regulator [Acidobacteria bacterium]|nr:helix-turn-helix transcriptional regulator [Acidobacteriota bacterium]
MKKPENEKPVFRPLGSFSSGRFDVVLSDYHRGLRQSWHRHDDFVLAMILRGYVREQVAARDELIRPLAVGLKSPDVRHTDHFWEKGVRVVRVALDAAFVSELKNESLLAEGWQWFDDLSATRPFLRIAGHLFRGDAGGAELADHLFEVLGALPPLKAAKPARHAPLWMRRARERLETSFADGVRLTELAADSGAHPVYFARRFREFFGCSVGRYARRLQLRKTAALLAEPENNLADIAARVGCADQAHLSRLFTAEFGLTPKQFRRLAE